MRVLYKWQPTDVRICEIHKFQRRSAECAAATFNLKLYFCVSILYYVYMYISMCM